MSVSLSWHVTLPTVLIVVSMYLRLNAAVNASSTVRFILQKCPSLLFLYRVRTRFFSEKRYKVSIESQEKVQPPGQGAESQEECGAKKDWSKECATDTRIPELCCGGSCGSVVMVGRDALWWEECCVFGGHGRDPGVVVGAVLCVRWQW